MSRSGETTAEAAQAAALVVGDNEMKLRLSLIAASCSLAALLSGTANAAVYNFAITGPQSVKFSLPSSPTPTTVTAGDFFVIDGVSGTIDNVADTFSLGFGSATYFSNFGLFNNSVGASIFSSGPTLYTGTELAPTFKLGTFALNTGYSVTISSGAVPEPASWAMMLAGIGTVGFAMRRRQAVRVAFA
jgi:hypothetical protein